MFKGSRLFIVSLAVLVSFIFVDTDKASAVVDPLTGYIVASALLHTLVIGGIVAAKYFKRENGGTASTSSHGIGSRGSIGRSATVTWVDLSADDTVGHKEKNVSAKIKFNDITTLANTSQYPNLKTAIDNAKRSYTLANEDTGWDVGSVYFDGYEYYQWTSKSDLMVYTYGSAPSSTTPVSYNSSTGKYFTTHTFGGTNGYTRQTFYGIRLGKNPPAPLVTPDLSKFVEQIDSDSDDNIEDVFKGEIDDFIKNNPNVIDYIDSEDPVGVDDAYVFTLPRTPSASDLDRAAARRASRTAKRNAWVNYSTHPDDPAALQDWLDRDAQDYRDRADDYDRENDNAVSLSSPGDVPDLDFSRFQDLKGALSSTYPFSLIGTLPDLLSPFVSSPSAPVIHLPVYGNDLVVDLSVFDPVAAVCRWCVGLLATAGVVYYIVHFWRGVS